MTELLNNYIGKECAIRTLQAQLVGTILGVNDGWVEIETPYGKDIINIDYIYRIGEYPRNKNGKKKAFLPD